jgi:hypothetical protein
MRRRAEGPYGFVLRRRDVGAPGLFFGGLSPYDDPIITDDLP